MPISRGRRGSTKESPGGDHYFDTGLRVAQSVAIVRQIPMIILGNGFGAVLGAFALHDEYGWLGVSPMVAIMLVLLLPIVWSWIKLRQRPEPPRVSPMRIRKLTLYSGALGLVWGVCIFVYLPGASSQTVDVLVLGCTVLALGSAGSVYVLPYASIAYSVPILVTALYVGAITSALDHGVLVWIVFAMALGIAWVLYANWVSFRSNVEVAADARRMLALAEHAIASRNAFLENVSHEIHTPLTSIVGYIDLLERDARSFTEGQRHSVAQLARATTGLMRLADDLIDISILDAGQAVIARTPMNVRALVDAAAGEVDALLRAKGIALSVHVGAHVPSSVEGDPGRTQKILGHLLDNAAKYTHRGSIRVEVGWLDGTHPGLEIHVIDTGIGISPAQREHVFQRFSQGDESTRRKHGGTGLGLAICRETLHLMNGSIEFASDGSSGTRFTVRMPTSAVPDPTTPTRVVEAAVSQTRLLVVDDDSAIRELLRQWLSRRGCLVEVADGGEAAVAACRRSHFDVILMDIQMPEMDGMEASAAIRGQVLNARTPIVAVTGYVSRDRIDAMRRAGIDDVIGKPVQEQALLDRLSKHLLQGNGSTPPH